MMILEMWEVVAAFAKNHPGEAKKRTVKLGDANGRSWINNELMLERYTLNGQNNTIVNVQTFDNANSSFIYTWWGTNGPQVGLLGTFERVPTRTAFMTYAPLIVVSGRTFDPQATALEVFETAPYAKGFMKQHPSGWELDGEVAGLRSRVTFSLGVLDTKGSLGERLVLILRGRELPLPGEAIDPAQPIEWTYFDLGVPGAAKPEPTYGIIGYGHEFIDLPQFTNFEIYGDLVPYEMHDEQFGPDFKF